MQIMTVGCVLQTYTKTRNQSELIAGSTSNLFSPLMKANFMNIFKATIISLCSVLVLLGCGESQSKQVQNSTSNNEIVESCCIKSKNQQKDVDYDFPVTSDALIRNYLILKLAPAIH